MLFFGNLHALSLQGMQNILGFITKSILSQKSVSAVYSAVCSVSDQKLLSPSCVEAVYPRCSVMLWFCLSQNSVSAVYTALFSVSNKKLLSLSSVEVVYPAFCSVLYTARAVYTQATLLGVQCTCGVVYTALYCRYTSLRSGKATTSTYHFVKHSISNTLGWQWPRNKSGKFVVNVWC